MTILFILLLAGAAFCAVMMSLWDWRQRIIPDVYLFPFLLIGLLVAAFFPWFFDVGEAVIAALAGYGLSFVMGWVFKKFAERRAQNVDKSAKCKVQSADNKNSELSSNNSSALCALRSANYYENAIGLGDVKLLAAGGIWLGTTGLAIALVVSCVLGGVWGLWRKQKFIPFAPFFFVGALIAVVFLIGFNA